MKIIAKELTYEFDELNQMHIEVEKQKNNGWDMEIRSAVHKHPYTEKLTVTIKYNLNQTEK